jgi:hypothetical protein
MKIQLQSFKMASLFAGSKTAALAMAAVVLIGMAAPARAAVLYTFEPPTYTADAAASTF